MRSQNARPLRVIAFAIGIALFWAALYVYVPTLAVHARDLGASDTMVGLVVGSYGLTQLLLRVPLGVLSDRLGVRKGFVLVGFATITTSAIGLAISKSPLHMILARALAGVAASSWVASTVLFSSFFPPAQAVRATSIMSFSSSIGQMTATLAGGYIAQHWGTGAPFWVAAVVAVIGFLAISPTPEEKQSAEKTPTFRQILSILTLPSLLAVSIVAAAVQYAAFATSYAFVPIYASEVLGLDSAQLGILTSVVLIPYALMTTVVANLATRMPERRFISVGLLLIAASTASTPLLSTYPALLVARAVFGLGLGLTYPVLMGLSIKSVPQAQRASAMGAFQAIYALGMTAGPTLSGFIADHLSLPLVFWVTGLMCLAALLPIWVSPRSPRRK